MAAGYAVVDVETTGFAARGADRIIEVAVVHLDEDGVVTDEWCTLVNPVRDLGPQHIHRISAAEVWHAPRFAEIAGALAARLRGRVMVAHNLSFDSRFLAAEFGRLGVELPVPGLCTMRLANQYLPDKAGRSLAACCAAAGVPLLNAHSALFDAQATASLFAAYLRVAGRPEPWCALLDEVESAPWPRFTSETAHLVRRGQVVAQRTTGTELVTLVRGDLVVFTGQMLDPRDVWVDRAAAAGLRVNQGYVTKATRVLVAADPFSLSTKARRARAYEVPIVSEEDFDAMLSQLN